jgi:hypothetical protein
LVCFAHLIFIVMILTGSVQPNRQRVFVDFDPGNLRE